MFKPAKQTSYANIQTYKIYYVIIDIQHVQTHIYKHTTIQTYTSMRTSKYTEHTTIDQTYRTCKHSKYSRYVIVQNIQTRQHGYKHTNMQPHNYTRHTRMHTYRYTTHTTYKKYSEHTSLQTMTYI